MSESPATNFEEYGGWTAALGRVADSHDLSREHAKAAMQSILSGGATAAQLAGFIVGLRVKGETVDELVGLAEGMLAAAEPLSLSPMAIDIVGTGGSKHRRAHALNVSTMASFVAAAAGAIVCKHGNYRASSTSGSFDFLDSLGIRTNLTPTELEACVAATGIGFALARTFHPSMRHAGPVRSELGIPTVFNVLGPLAHPGQPNRQLLGTASEPLAQRMAAVRAVMGSELTWVVAGADGLDELSTTGVNVVHIATPDGVERVEVHPVDVGLKQAGDLGDLAGGNPESNVAIFGRMLEGEPSPARDIVVFNAAAGLLVAGQVSDLAVGVAEAQAALDDGRVKAKVSEVAKFTTA